MRQGIRQYITLKRMSCRILTVLFISVFFQLSSHTLLIAQNLSIEGFNNLPLDLSSRTESVKDNNNVPCALVKIICNDEITDVQGNVVKSEEYGNEYWVYLSEGTKYIKIFTRHHAPLDFNIIDFLKTGAISQTTYKLELKSDLTPDILYGSSNPLIPVTMAKEGESLLPKWWNVQEEGMYVGISVPTLDGEIAKLSAITNAIYSFAHSTGCMIRYMAETNQHDEESEYMAVYSGLEKGFSIRISQEYYNSNGEYFVLCAINKDAKLSNAMMINWTFNDVNSKGSLSVEVAVQAKLNRFPFENIMKYEVSWSNNFSTCKLTCNDKKLIDNHNLGTKDNIADIALDGDIGLSQVRLLTAIPLLTDSISFTSMSTVSDVSSSFTIRINGVGHSVPQNIQLLNYKDQKLMFGISERFANELSINDGNGLKTSQTTGLSDKYNCDYVDTTGKATAIKSHGYCDDTLFEAAKNKSFLSAVSDGVNQLFSEVRCSSNLENESTDTWSGENNISRMYSQAQIYPMYYLDPDQRVDCKEKKYRKTWLACKMQYPQKVSIVIPIKSLKQ